jgi:hypothetical protein
MGDLEQLEQLEQLERWLREEAGVVGRTLPVPIVKGGKAPLRAHAARRGETEWRWTWGELAAFKEKDPGAKTCGWGLLLDGLCVVDADTAEAVAWLEGLGVAELERCPMQV